MRDLKQYIKARSQELGFFYCGFSKAEFLEDEARKLDLWLKSGFHGKMGYMENHYDKRLDPRKLFDGARTVVSMALNYFHLRTYRPMKFQKFLSMLMERIIILL